MSDLRKALKQEAASALSPSWLGVIRDVARKTLDPITDEELKAAWNAFDAADRTFSNKGSWEESMRGALDAFLKERFGSDG